MAKDQLKQNLLGCFEICLFMREGVERFENNREAAFKSFWLPALALPIVLAFLASEQIYLEVEFLFLQLIRIIAGVALFFAMSYLIAKQLDRLGSFYRYITAINWLTLPSMLLITPIFFFQFQSKLAWDGLESYAIFTGILFYILTGFIATFALRLPWQLGAVVAIAGLAIDETLRNLFEAADKLI